MNTYTKPYPRFSNGNNLDLLLIMKIYNVCKAAYMEITTSKYSIFEILQNASGLFNSPHKLIVASCWFLLRFDIVGGLNNENNSPE